MIPGNHCWLLYNPNALLHLPTSLSTPLVKFQSDGFDDL